MENKEEFFLTFTQQMICLNRETKKDEKGLGTTTLRIRNQRLKRKASFRWKRLLMYLITLTKIRKYGIF